MSTDAKPIELALGRLLLLVSRSYRDGDIEQYEMCRRVIMECAPSVASDYSTSYARDRLKGAQGDA